MNLNLYTTTSDPRAVNKTINSIASGIPIKPTSDVALLSPNIIINFSAAYLSANYAYIPQFGRYYFINNAVVKIGSEIVLSMKVDPLMSFANQIRGCQATVIRSESIGKPTMIPDNKLPILPNVKQLTSIVLQNNSLTNSAAYSYVLTVIGANTTI